ncbi:MAG: hypothetical protein N4A54_07470 [Peptostreptococcaceae bacterium]|jgi:hypothetical protein|nr:hypothetical protein [Peptostreptococcaceae bacterium]
MPVKEMIRKEMNSSMGHVTFSLKTITAGEADTLLKRVNSCVNSMNNSNPNFLKICASDMKGKDSRAVIFYADHDEDFDIEAIPRNTNWNMIKKQTGSDYNKMYENILEELNNLSLYQQLHAKVVFTNAANNKSQMAIYYPN